MLFFKALLFLSCGIMILYGWGGQDSRYLSFSFVGYYVVILCFFLSCVSLMGFSFSSGFYSKDLMLEFLFSDFMLFDLMMVYFGCFLTVVYGFRLIVMGVGFFEKMNALWLFLMKIMS